MNLTESILDLLRCRELGRKKQRCILHLWHRGRHKFKVDDKRYLKKDERPQTVSNGGTGI